MPEDKSEKPGGAAAGKGRAGQTAGHRQGGSPPGTEGVQAAQG